MSSLWDGSGNIVRDNGTNSGSALWQADRDASIKITASNHDTHDENLADSLELALNLNGENSPAADIDWGANKITNLTDGAANGEAVVYGQPGVEFVSTVAGAAAGPTLELDRQITAATDNLIGQVTFTGRDDGGNTQAYGAITCKVADATNGSEDGQLNFNLAKAGTGGDLLQLIQAGVMQLLLTDSGASAGPVFRLVRGSSSAAVDDDIGQIVFRGDDDGGNDTDYARITARISDPTDGSEDSQLRFDVPIAGSFPSAPQLTVSNAFVKCEADQNSCLRVDRTTDDGNIVLIQQDGTTEGTISVSGTTVSYNGFQGSHSAEWSDADLIKNPPPRGTWLESTDEVFNIPGPDLNHEGLCKVRVAQPGSKRVCGVYLDDMELDGERKGILIASVGGPFMCRFSGAVEGGDFVTIIADGIAGQQADDLRRSSTAGKVWRGDDQTGDRLVSITFECGG